MKMISIAFLTLLFMIIFLGCFSLKAQTSIYKTPENEAKIMSIYHKKLKKWPIPYESMLVPTRFGKTHVISSGQKNAPHIVLIHAMGATATMWLPNVKTLSQKYRVYALDTIGDIGKSSLDNLEFYPKNGEDYSKWLTDVFNELGIEKAHVIGASMGGWITLNHSIHSPERVYKIVLLGPMGIPSATIRVMWHLMSVLLFPTQSNKEKLIRWAIGDNEAAKEALVEHMRTALNCRGKLAIPKKLSDDELRNIKAPTLLLLGEKDNPIGNPIKAKERAEKLIPNIKVLIIEKSGHMMNIEYPEFVNSQIIAFLKNN